MNTETEELVLERPEAKVENKCERPALPPFVTIPNINTYINELLKYENEAWLNATD